METKKKCAYFVPRDDDKHHHYDAFSMRGYLIRK